ncbi:MAG: hypothetical protein K0S56_567 [Microvirga sp.]|nr:hypothetical protein [Microvirga sp.]
MSAADMGKHKDAADIIAAQVRGARGLLGISQATLAERSRVSRSTIADLESGKRLSHDSTLQIVISTLTTAGVRLTPRGVEIM